LHGSVRQRAGGADESGGNPAESRAFEWAPLSVSRRRSRGLRKTPRWSAARRTPYVIGRAPQGVSMLPAPFGAPLPSRSLRSPHVCEGELPLVSEGMEIPALPAPCENRGGGALALSSRAV